MAGPSDAEQLLLEYLNETRMHPLGSAARYLTGYAPLRSSLPDVQSAISYFGVDGAALKAAYQALSPVAPLAWNDALAAAARAHSQVMIDTDSQTHQAPGEPDLGQRATNAGYTGWRSLGENVYAYSESPLYAHAGFMIDWGPGPSGMQSPAGHRDNIMSASFTEVGIGILSETSGATEVGPQVTSQEFGTRLGANRFLLGVAYTDRDGNDFYSPGEGRGDLTASGGAAVRSYASGGYQLAIGMAPVALTGGGLTGPVTVAPLANGGNLKADVVNGNELWTYGGVIVTGRLAMVQGLGFGTQITAGDGQNYTLRGTAGLDRLTGGAGHDNLFGAAGADSLSGGDGNDHLYGQSANGGEDGADSLSGGNGADYLQGNAGKDWLDGNNGSDRLVGGAGDDVVNGGKGNDSLNGNLGNDTLDGGLNNDYVRGGQGNDRVGGGHDDDQLLGDLGDDTLLGGYGQDQLTGGAGADRFQFDASDATFAGGLSDVILDWTDGTDRLAIGFAPAVVLTGTAQPGLDAAAAFAQTLLAAHSGGNEVAAVRVGDDTLLFWNAGGLDLVNAAVRLAGIDPAAIGTGDFA